MKMNLASKWALADTWVKHYCYQWNLVPISVIFSDEKVCQFNFIKSEDQQLYSTINIWSGYSARELIYNLQHEMSHYKMSFNYTLLEQHLFFNLNLLSKLSAEAWFLMMSVNILADYYDIKIFMQESASDNSYLPLLAYEQQEYRDKLAEEILEQNLLKDIPQQIETMHLKDKLAELNIDCNIEKKDKQSFVEYFLSLYLFISNKEFNSVYFKWPGFNRFKFYLRKSKDLSSLQVCYLAFRFCFYASYSLKEISREQLVLVWKLLFKDLNPKRKKNQEREAQYGLKGLNLSNTDQPTNVVLPSENITPSINFINPETMAALESLKKTQCREIVEKEYFSFTGRPSAKSLGRFLTLRPPFTKKERHCIIHTEENPVLKEKKDEVSKYSIIQIVNPFCDEKSRSLARDVAAQAAQIFYREYKQGNRSLIVFYNTELLFNFTEADDPEELNQIALATILDQILLDPRDSIFYLKEDIPLLTEMIYQQMRGAAWVLNPAESNESRVPLMRYWAGFMNNQAKLITVAASEMYVDDLDMLDSFDCKALKKKNQFVLVGDL